MWPQHHHAGGQGPPTDGGQGAASMAMYLSMPQPAYPGPAMYAAAPMAPMGMAPMPMMCPVVPGHMPAIMQPSYAHSRHGDSHPGMGGTRGSLDSVTAWEAHLKDDTPEGPHSAEALAYQWAQLLTDRECRSQLAAAGCGGSCALGCTQLPEASDPELVAQGKRAILQHHLLLHHPLEVQFACQMVDQLAHLATSRDRCPFGDCGFQATRHVTRPSRDRRAGGRAPPPAMKGSELEDACRLAWHDHIEGALPHGVDMLLCARATVLQAQRAMQAAKGRGGGGSSSGVQIKCWVEGCDMRANSVQAMLAHQALFHHETLADTNWTSPAVQDDAGLPQAQILSCPCADCSFTSAQGTGLARHVAQRHAALVWDVCHHISVLGMASGAASPALVSASSNGEIHTNGGSANGGGSSGMSGRPRTRRMLSLDQETKEDGDGACSAGEGPSALAGLRRLNISRPSGASLPAALFSAAGGFGPGSGSSGGGGFTCPIKQCADSIQLLDLPRSSQANGGQARASRHAPLHMALHDSLAELQAHIQTEHAEAATACMAFVTGLAYQALADSSNDDGGGGGGGVGGCIFSRTCPGLPGGTIPLAGCTSVGEAAASLEALLGHGLAAHTADIIAVYHAACTMVSVAAVGDSGVPGAPPAPLRCPFGCSGSDALLLSRGARSSRRRNGGSGVQALLAERVYGPSSRRSGGGGGAPSPGGAQPRYADRAAVMLHMMACHARELQRMVRTWQDIIPPRILPG